MAAVFKVVCTVAPFDIFYHMSFEELLEQLKSLVPSHIRSKVAVVSEQLMQIIHSFRSSETAVIVTKVCPMPSKRHTSSEKFNGFIPLHLQTETQLSLTNDEVKENKMLNYII